MRHFLKVLLIAGVAVAGPSFAQSERPAIVLQATTASEPALREALQDESVQAALRAYVRGIDTQLPRESDDAYSIRAAAVGRADDSAEGFRILSEGQLRSLEARSPSQTPFRARPVPQQRGDSQDGDSSLPPINATPVPRGPGDISAETRPHFDPEFFSTWLHTLLQDSVNGYVMRIRQHGQTVYTLQWNWAQRPEDAGLGWNPDRRQHVASISKFITAMGLAHMLEAQGIGFDTPIIDYLPDYWQKGPNIESITFAHLMNHIAGFIYPNSGSSNYALMQARVAQGVNANAVGNWQTADYENMNFGLCRILMAVLGGYVDADADFGIYNDVIWNWITVAAYSDYIHANVFAPAGVTGAVLANQSDSARGYAWDGAGPALDSGILTSEAGGAGWHLSADEVLDVVGEFRRGGGIVSTQCAVELMNLSYGLNSPIGGWPAPTGNFYFKPGRWWNGTQAEQALVMVLPEDYEVAIFVNSPLGAQDMQLQAFGGTLYLLSIVE